MSGRHNQASASAHLWNIRDIVAATSPVRANRIGLLGSKFWRRKAAGRDGPKWVPFETFRGPHCPRALATATCFRASALLPFDGCVIEKTSRMCSASASRKFAA
jgi:hypothetical protein